MPHGGLLSFGPYLLDTSAMRLTRDGEEVLLGNRHLSLLYLLASRPGEVLSKDLLTETVWSGTAVTTNSLDQAISTLRRTLTCESGEPIIETRARRGYRFVANVSQVARREPEDTLDAVLDTHRAWIDGRAALETLEAGAIVRARAAFERVVERMPEQAPPHVGLANALALQFEMTRTDAEPDVVAIRLALDHALEARRLDPKYGEAWATLGFVLERVGRRDDALAAARQSIVLEPDNWRHHLRLSACSWGEERLREARRTLSLLPGLAMAHWLAATVLVARGALDEAEPELVAGLAVGPLHFAQDTTARFTAVALHWLLGLIALAKGDAHRALDGFDRELQQEQSNHLYARECAANTWYGIGAVRFAAGDRDGAQDAFLECLRRVPTHVLARAALGQAPPATGASGVDRAIAQAIYRSVDDERAERHSAAPTIERALVEAPPGNAGWLLPVEPMLAIASRQTPWVSVLGRIRSRAA